MKSQGASVLEIQEKRKSRRFRFLAVLSIGAFIVLMGGGSWFFLRSPMLRIEHFEIHGSKRLSDSEVLGILEERLIGGSAIKRVLGFSHLFVWPDEFIIEKDESVPGLKRLSAHVRGRTALVSVEERVPSGIWCRSREDPPQCFWFDDEGVLYESAPAAEGNLVIVVTDRSEREIGSSSHILPEELIAQAFSVFHVLEDAAIPTKEILLEDLALQELKVTTYGGPTLYFSLRFSAENTRSVIETLRAKKAEWEKIEYIDFRVENRAYYK